jgi:alkyl hydroperoxide reductase subunit AhpC
LGGLPYPELSDFHPKGKASQAYDLYNEERGASFRAVIVVDKGGIIRYRETYEPGILPDTAVILATLDKLG